MKKSISYVIAAVMIAALLSGCGMMNNTGNTEFPMATADTALPTPSTQVGSTGTTGGMSTPDVNVTSSPAPTAASK